jgi:glycosyltransferase involved in cell wall biosynthesis
MQTGPRILIVVNVDWFFLSHRLPIARAARDAGAEVVIAAADTGRSEEIRREGFGFVPIPLSRSGTNIFAELRVMGVLAKMYRKMKPDLVHHVTIKPVIYGSLAARIMGVKAVVNAITGLGFSFSDDGRTHVLRPLAKTLYRLVLGFPRSCTVFQNPDDRDDFVRMSLVPLARTALIRGSGVDCSRFRVTAPKEDAPIVMFAGRMLWDKGVGIFIEASRILHVTHPEARFILVGAVDSANPATVSMEQIQDWTAERAVEWWGDRTDMPDVLSDACIVALPSTHREGLPKVLLEAAACGRPLVASDVPGCREIVRHEVNGLLVPPRDSHALALAIGRLLESTELRNRFSRAGREIVEQEFSQEIIVRQTLGLYRKMLGGAWRQNGTTGS